MFLMQCWIVLCELAPWLLLGMLISGVMHVLLPRNFIRQNLTGWFGVIKAVALGIPLPLCSCGVIPAAIGLKNQGASNGAAVGFLISTPQTGVDSILVSTSFFGWPFALFKMFAAAITGILGGWLTNQLTSQPSASPSSNQLPLRPHAANTKPLKVASWSRQAIEIWQHGSEILQSIWMWLVIGILISAALDTLIPPAWLQQLGQWGLLPAMLLMLIVSLPLYVCATASVPIAAAFVHGGLPPAAALVFLMAGPATNITTMGAILDRFGWRTLLSYLSTIVVGSMAGAWLFDWLLTAELTDANIHAHQHQNWWSITSALVLLAMIVHFAWQRGRTRFRRSQPLDPNLPVNQLTVTGLTCQNCVDRLEQALQSDQQIDSAIVDLATGKTTVIGTIAADRIRSLVRTAGFEVAEPQ